MARSFWTLAVAAGLLATSAALSPQDIPSDVPVADLLTSAQTHLVQGQTSEALIYYDAAIARDPSNYLSLFKRGATYLSLGRTNQATEDFNKVLAIQPNFEGAHVQLAKIKVKTADWDGARAEYAAGNKGPDSEEVKELEEASGAARLAQEAEGAKKWEDCVNHAGAAIMVASRAASLRSLRSRCRFERGEVEEGLADMQHVLSLRPGDTGPHVTISATTFYGLGDLENGISQIRKCLHSDPDSKVCKKLHKNEKAIQKAYEKIQANLQRGQTTTAGRALVGTSEDRGLIPKIKEQFEELRQDGSIVGMARSILYDNAVEAACQAYTEVSSPP
jgi:DnaJ family protein C protein 3